MDRRIPDRLITCDGATLYNGLGEHRVVHRIASLSLHGFPPLQRFVYTAQEVVSSEFFRELLGWTTPDHCICACSSGGCRPISLALKRCSEEQFEPTSVAWTWYLLDDYQKTLGQMLDKLDGEKLVQDVIRFLTFSALELKHTCCEHMDCFYEDYWKLIYLKSADEVEEIRDEEAELIIRLESLVADFVEQFDELRIPLSEFLLKHWRNKMWEECTKKDVIPECDKQKMEEFGVRILDQEESDVQLPKTLAGLQKQWKKEQQDEGKFWREYETKTKEKEENFVNGYDKWIQGIANSIK